MVVKYSANAQKDLEYWRQYGTDAIRAKITALIKSIETTPFEGRDKPEPLKHNLTKKWSRRINKKHRIIYNVTDYIEILSLCGHYEKS
jgi:toxin YoeB